MISVTLNFKTVEAARQALLDIPTSALVGYPDAEEKPAAKKAAKAQAPAAEPAPAKPQPSPAEAGPKAAAAASAPAAAPASAAPSVDYTTLQKAVFALAGKSREAAAAIAHSFGVKTFKELPADKWGAALEAVNAKIAELEAA